MSLWEKLLDTAQDVAPSLAGAAGTALGGPAVGALASAAARKAVGADDQADLETVASQVLADPEALQRFRMQMRRAELEQQRIRAADVQDARKALKISKGAIWVSLFVVVAYSVAVIMVLTLPIPESSRSLAYLVLGNLGTGFGMVLTFWLGSSVGSKEKENTLQTYADAVKHDQRRR